MHIDVLSPHLAHLEHRLKLLLLFRLQRNIDLLLLPESLAAGEGTRLSLDLRQVHLFPLGGELAKRIATDA